MKKIISIILFSFFYSTVVVYAIPANDNFTDRETMAGSSGTETGSNNGATFQEGEPHFGNSNTVWWTWTPLAPGSYKIDTYGSDFDTYLSVFTGNSVSSLTYVTANNDANSTGESLVCFDVETGTTYQIQVSGNQIGDYGNIILNRSPATWTDWIFVGSSTQTYFKTFFASDMTALYFKKVRMAWGYIKTNEFGCIKTRSDLFYFLPDGLTIENKKKKLVVDGKQFDGGNTGIDEFITDYNGKSVLTIKNETKTLSVYDVKKGAFKKVGEKVIDNLIKANFNGNEIHVGLFDKPDGVHSEGFIAFDKKLEKEKWKVPLAPGSVRLVGKKLTARKLNDWVANTSTITYRKSGKKVVAQHILNLPTNEAFYTEFDSKGGILFWTQKNYTNSPITYLDRKNRKVLEDGTLDEVGLVWEFQSFDGKLLYVKKKVSDGNFIFYLYKIKGLKILGEKNVGVTNNGTARLSSEKNVYIYSQYYDTSWKRSVTICDKKLKKEMLPEQFEEGTISQIAKDIFVRKTSETFGDTTTVTYKIFGTKGDIVTYVFSYTKE